MTTTGYNNALRRLAELMGDEIRVYDGAENWVLWCLIDANRDGSPDPLADVVYSVNTTGIYKMGPDGYIQYPPVLRVLPDEVTE